MRDRWTDPSSRYLAQKKNTLAFFFCQLARRSRDKNRTSTKLLIREAVNLTSG
jgi:hypothetical protein